MLKLVVIAGGSSLHASLLESFEACGAWNAQLLVFLLIAVCLPLFVGV